MVPPYSACSGVSVARSLHLEVLRRRFSTVAYDLEFDLLAIIERGQARLLHRGNVYEYIPASALRLDESIAFGRIEPLHSAGRHRNSPRVDDVRAPHLHIPATVAIKNGAALAA